MKILDATSGNRAIWFDKNCRLTTFIDIRPEVIPDKVMDCAKTNGYPKGYQTLCWNCQYIKRAECNG